MEKESRLLGCLDAKAFTLIELLVVVLIIGILAAVALPQYQKAVWKSRFTQAKVLATAIAQAEEIYYMANGIYTEQFDELDVDIPATTEPVSCGRDSYGTTSCTATFTWGTCHISNTDMANTCMVLQNAEPLLAYSVGWDHSTSYLGSGARCIAWGKTTKPTASDISYQICVTETNNGTKGSWGGRSDYWMY